MPDALEASGVGVQRGRRQIVRDVSLSVQHGTLLAIAGPNGAGKSSLLRALLGLLPASGAIHIDGAPLASLTAAERARSLAYVPQRGASLAFVSVQDVVAQARYAHRDRFGWVDPHDPTVTRALERTELTALAERAFDTLSGGEQRRVLLARALATGARTLLFDEPTAGLDVAHVLRFFALVQQLKSEGHAIVCVLHDLSDVRRHADTVLLLDRGRSAAFGPVAQVMTAEHIAAVYGVQVHEHVAPGFSLDGGWP